MQTGKKDAMNVPNSSSGREDAVRAVEKSSDPGQDRGDFETSS